MNLHFQYYPNGNPFWLTNIITTCDRKAPRHNKVPKQYKTLIQNMKCKRKREETSDIVSDIRAGIRKTVEHTTDIEHLESNWKIVEEESYQAMYENYRRTNSNPFYIPLANLCKIQALDVRAKVKILFYLDKYVRKNGIVHVDEDDNTEGSWMNVLQNLHYQAFFYNRFRN